MSEVAIHIKQCTVVQLVLLFCCNMFAARAFQMKMISAGSPPVLGIGALLFRPQGMKVAPAQGNGT